MKNWILFFFLITCLSSAHSQEELDSLPYTLYKDRVVMFADLGLSSSPFTIKDDFNEGVTTLKFKHNLRLGMGIGVMYKWFALRVGFGLPGTIRPKSRFGQPQFLDLGVNFSVKQSFWDIDFRTIKTYAIVKANAWNDTLNDLSPNLIRPNLQTGNFSANSWFFKNKNFKMPAVLGRVGHFTRDEGTWYLKGTFNIFGITNGDKAITPAELIDTVESKSYAHNIWAIDVGVVPGYAYVGRINNWQYSVFGGLGGVIQSKFYTYGQTDRGVLGLAPRLDLRFIAGYSKPGYFFWIVSDFDVKSIRINEMRYNQTFYNIKLVGGIRLKERVKDKKLNPIPSGS